MTIHEIPHFVVHFQKVNFVTTLPQGQGERPSRQGGTRRVERLRAQGAQPGGVEPGAEHCAREHATSRHVQGYLRLSFSEDLYVIIFQIVGM